MSFNSETTITLAVSAFCVTVMIIILAIEKVQRRNKYKRWKKDTLNLLVFKREWESDSDALFETLQSKNSRLAAENRALKKEYSNLSILALILFLVTLFITRLHSKKKLVG